MCFPCRGHFHVPEIVAEAQRKATSVASVYPRQEGGRVCAGSATGPCQRGQRGRGLADHTALAPAGPTRRGRCVSGLGRDKGHSRRQTFVHDATGEKFEVPGLFLTEKVVNRVFKITTTHLH